MPEKSLLCASSRACAWVEIEGVGTRFRKTWRHKATYTGAGPSIVMMGLRPSFFLFLFTAPFAAVAGAEFVPLPLAPAMREAVVEGGLEGLASMWPGVVDLDTVLLAGAGSEPAASFLPFMSGSPAPDKNQEQVFFFLGFSMAR